MTEDLFLVFCIFSVYNMKLQGKLVSKISADFLCELIYHINLLIVCIYVFSYKDSRKTLALSQNLIFCSFYSYRSEKYLQKGNVKSCKYFSYYYGHNIIFVFLLPFSTSRMCLVFFVVVITYTRAKQCILYYDVIKYIISTANAKTHHDIV